MNIYYLDKNCEVIWNEVNIDNQLKEKYENKINEYINIALKDILNEVENLYDTWYDEEDGDYSLEEVKNMAKELMNYVSVANDGSSIWISYNTDPNNSPIDFFGGHSMEASYEFNKDTMELIKVYEVDLIG